MLDACVLYPAPVRDILLWLADSGLYQPKWSKQIQEEWSLNVLHNRPDLQKQQLDRAVQNMNAAFPDAEVKRFSSMIPNLTLPDKDDRHVLAAAIKCKAGGIVTYNLKDFPDHILSKYNITALHPDAFILGLIDLDETKAVKAFKQHVNSLKNPPKTEKELLVNLEKLNLTISVHRLRGILK
ncbi:MAG: PIN domain-containing protein, partial [Balneolales bacterium]